MASILIYTSPARGHLYPVLGTALGLRDRGYSVNIRTLSSEVHRVCALGLSAEPIAPGIEARELDDWRGSNTMQVLEFAMRTFGDRALMEVDDVQQAIEETGADVLLVDTNSWGAQAVAEASGLPWATFQPYFTALPAPGVPPFGPGLQRSTNLVGRTRDALAGKVIISKMSQYALPSINATRTRLGLEPLVSYLELLQRPPRVFYFTVEELEYPREQWPESFRLVGPTRWEPPTEAPEWLAEINRPIALVTLSTERQGDRDLIDTALNVLPQQGYYVIATTAAHAPEEFGSSITSDYRVERFIPHNPLLNRAAVVICHGGMGITQRALAYGVPVVVVPFGRDQPEVARRVEYAEAGVRLLPKDLNAETLTSSVREARSRKEGATRIANAFAGSGGDTAVVEGIEELLGRMAVPQPAVFA
ncbi:MAG: glycosyltransferase [Chloroflexota bacterium]